MQMKSSVIFVNLICYSVIYGFFFCIFKSLKYTFIGANLFCFIIGLVNNFVLKFRDCPILPSDLYSIRTAANVAGNYEYEINFTILFAIGLFLFTCILAIKMKNYHLKQTFKNQLKILGCYSLFLVLIGFFFFKTDFLKNNGIYTYPWYQKSAYAKCGFFPSFIANIQYMLIEKPEGYSEKQVNQDIKENTIDITTQYPNKTTKKKPNIIAIMDESFSDLSILGDFDTNEDYMPFIRKMKKNTIKGQLYVSAYGGNTCNTEFEFLTGNSLGFLPSGSIPYQQYIKRPYDSLASILKDQGYQSIALHPYYPGGWNRNNVYPLLGFDEFLSISDFANPIYYREYISDQSDFEKIIEEYEKRKDNDPLFLFNVTMQNHSGYEKGEQTGFENTIKITKGPIYSSVEEYLSLIRLTDQAFEYLISYFKKVEEPTIIVFFGDHQPGVTSSFYQSMLGKDPNTWSLDTLQKKYTIPFLIWTNYDIEEQNLGTLSPNFLSSIVLKTAGLEMPAYHQFLLEINKEIRAINANGYLGVDGINYKFEEPSPYQNILLQYQRVQYNNMFDKKKRQANLFGLSYK